MVNQKRRLVLVVHNVRSALNVGSMLRTADGLGAEKVYLTGITPYPAAPNDTRLPHLARKMTTAIAKTALGADKTVDWEYSRDAAPVIKKLAKQKFAITALEQTPDSRPLAEFHPAQPVALVVGNEIQGLQPELLKLCSETVEIPMLGSKESFNVAVAAAIALYHLRYLDKNAA